MALRPSSTRDVPIHPAGTSSPAQADAPPPRCPEPPSRTTPSPGPRLVRLKSGLRGAAPPAPTPARRYSLRRFMIRGGGFHPAAESIPGGTGPDGCSCHVASVVCGSCTDAVSYTHLRAHETDSYL